MTTHQRTPRAGDMWRLRPPEDRRRTVRVISARLEGHAPEVTVKLLTSVDGKRIAKDYALTFPLAGFHELYEHAGERGPRRMPSMKRVLRHHGIEGRCCRCGYDGYLERAHIIDRVFGGLDTGANLAPLCSWCHRGQPIFEPGQEDEARDWFGLAPLEPLAGQPVSVSGRSSTTSATGLSAGPARA